MRSGIARGKQIPKPVPGRLDHPGITEAFAHRMMYSVAKDQYTARDFDAYQGLAYTDASPRPGTLTGPFGRRQGGGVGHQSQRLEPDVADARRRAWTAPVLGREGHDRGLPPDAEARAPDLQKWNRQLHCVRLFHQLTHNADSALAKLKALDRPTLKERLSPWLGKVQMRVSSPAGT